MRMLIYWGKTNTTNKNKETLSYTSNEGNLEISAEKTTYMFMMQPQNAGKNHNIKTGNKSFKSMAKFKYSRKTETNQNCSHKEIRKRLNSGNAYYHSDQNFLSSHLLSQTVKITTHKTIIVPVALYGFDTWSLNLRKEHTMSEKKCQGKYLDLW
jgi:hypothetical protein